MPFDSYVMDLLVAERNELAFELEELERRSAAGQPLDVTEKELEILENRLKALVKLTSARLGIPETIH